MKLQSYEDFINESVDNLEVTIYKANNKKWYLEVDEYEDYEDYDDDEDPSEPELVGTHIHGPFDSEEDADKYLGNEYPNPGGYRVDSSGKRTPPKYKYNKK